MAFVRLEWDLLPQEDNVARYEIERRTMHVDAAVLGRLNRFWHNATGARSLMGGWRQVGEVPANQDYFVDDGRMLVRRFFRPTYYHNSEILDYVHYEYRIRAVNHTNQAGVWRHCRVTPLTAPPPHPGYLIYGNVSEIGGARNPVSTITIHNPHASTIRAERTDRSGNYRFNLGPVLPPGIPATDDIFCDAGPTYFRMVARGIPMPSVATPNIVCNFVLHPRPAGPRGARPPAWAPPAGYRYW